MNIARDATIDTFASAAISTSSLNGSQRARVHRNANTAGSKMMRAIQLAVACVAVLGATAGRGRAGVIVFDDAYNDLGEQGDPATYYGATLGVSFSGSYLGTLGGNGNGDFGGWSLEGTNGSAFLGVNSGVGTGPDISFDTVVNNVSLDVGLPGFGWTNDITLSSYLNGGLVESQTVNISSPSNPGNWQTVSFNSPLDGIEVRLGTGNGFAFGVDNINFSTTAVPEPSSLALFGIGACVACVGAASRRRREKQQETVA